MSMNGKPSAAQLKAEADALFEAKRYADALAVYAHAYELSSDPALLYNQGRALQFLARYPEAVDFLVRFRDAASPELRAKVPKLDELLADLQARVATLDVTADAAGALVLLDDRLLGTLPFASPVRVNAGKHTLAITAEGRFPYRAPVDLPGGRTTKIDVVLPSKATTGVLVVRSGVEGARVSVDGRSVGAAPIETALDAGQHGVTVEADGYDATTTTVLVEAGNRREISVDPTSRPSVLTRWWFWAGVGVVVAAGVTTYVALTHERSPDHGSFTPGNVAVGLRF